MKNDQKNNPFLNPELQNLQNSLNQIKRAYSGYSQIILPPDSLSSRIHQLQEEIVKPYRQIFQLYTPTMVASLTESFSKMSEIMTATIRENITTGVYNNLNESLKQSLSLLELQKQFLNLPPELHFHSDLSNYSEDLGGLPEDDFVIVDDTTVKTYELPDSVYIPIGNNRIKMPTSFLLALIDLIISTILTISIAIAQSNSSRTEPINQMQIEESQLELQRAQNEMLQQLLHNIDTSSSSEAETIKELKKTVEELNKQCSPTQDTCSPVEEDTDNSKSTEDTDIQE
jgi:hypothetical protein